MKISPKEQGFGILLVFVGVGSLIGSWLLQISPDYDVPLAQKIAWILGIVGTPFAMVIVGFYLGMWWWRKVDKNSDKI